MLVLTEHAERFGMAVDCLDNNVGVRIASKNFSNKYTLT